MHSHFITCTQVNALVDSYRKSIIFDQYGLVLPAECTDALDPHLAFPRGRTGRVPFESMIDTRTNMCVHDTVMKLQQYFHYRFRDNRRESITDRPVPPPHWNTQATAMQSLDDLL